MGDTDGRKRRNDACSLPACVAAFWLADCRCLSTRRVLKFLPENRDQILDSGLCQQPSAAISVSASEGPQVPRS